MKFYKYALNNPILAIGILLMIVFILNLREKGYFANNLTRFHATSCKSVLVMLNKRMPKIWQTNCAKNSLTIKIPSLIDKTAISEMVKIKTYLYRELANHLVFIAKNSLNESLERTDWIVIHLDSTYLKINALTKGKHLAKFATMANSKLIAEHLQATVQVQELIK